MLKQRLDFLFENKFETMDRLHKIKGQKLLNKRLDFPFENKFKTTDIIPRMHGEKNVETTVRFSISQQVSNY